MRALVFTLMCIAACQTAIAATVYKWVDADGVTHYTDQPHPGAQKLQLQGAQTYSAAAAQRGSSAAAAQGARRTPSAAPVYSTCEVTRPTNDEVFVNASSVPASVHVDPGLRSGDRVTVMLDGAPLPVNTPVDTEFVLSSVVRGTHALTTKVEDASGAVVCQSASVIFHVRQPSVLAPNQANRPH
jgi:Domain of unknown function (DUF4124)